MNECINCVHHDTDKFGLYCMLVTPAFDFEGNCLEYDPIEFEHETAEIL